MKDLFKIAIVESNEDSLGLGRLKVRVIGEHNLNRSELPTDALPYAITLNNSIGGVGESPTKYSPGQKVLITFLDENKEQILVLGALNTLIDSIDNFETNIGSSNIFPSIFENENKHRTFDEFECEDGELSLNYNEVNQQLSFINKVYSDEFCYPTSGFISSAYGARGVSKHLGVDICNAGFFNQLEKGGEHLNGRLVGDAGIVPVVSVANGTVIHIWRNNQGQRNVSSQYDINGRGSRSFGNAVAIKHTTKTLGSCISIYSHLGNYQDASRDLFEGNGGISVNVGDRVIKGQQIGLIGRTHNYSQLTHLHFEIRVGGKLPKSNNHINPALIFPKMLGVHKAFMNSIQNKKWDSDILFNISEIPMKFGESL